MVTLATIYLLSYTFNLNYIAGLSSEKNIAYYSFISTLRKLRSIDMKLH